MYPSRCRSAEPRSSVRSVSAKTYPAGRQRTGQMTQITPYASAAADRRHRQITLYANAASPSDSEEPASAMSNSVLRPSVIVPSTADTE